MARIYVLYAVALIGIGMLTHTGNNVAMDSFGPISDNANGIGEMAWHDMEDEETSKARQIMADLDAVGNTTKAITKGVAIASAVIAAVSLFASFITDVGRVQAAAGHAGAWTCASAFRIPTVFIGLLIGGALPWLFCSLSIQAVSRAAGADRGRSAPAVPHPRHHGRHRDAGLCAGGGHLHRLGAERTDPAGDHRGAHAAPGRPGPAGRGAGRLPGRHHPLRPAAGGVHVERRRRLGQRQEGHRR